MEVVLATVVVEVTEVLVLPLVEVLVCPVVVDIHPVVWVHLPALVMEVGVATVELLQVPKETILVLPQVGVLVQMVLVGLKALKAVQKETINGWYC